MTEMTVIASEVMPMPTDIDVKVATANKYPRKIADVKADLLEYATTDKEVAEKCYYFKPVGGGKFATGPGIRLMEIAAAVYGNIMHATRVVEIDRQGGRVKVQGVAFDLQKNISFTSEVTRSIKTKAGHLFGETMIDTTIKAAAAIADRDALAKVIPMGIFSKEMKLIQQKSLNVSTPEDIQKKYKDYIAWLEKKGANEGNVLYALGCKQATEIKEGELIMLKGIINAIADDEAKVDDCFPRSPQENMKAKSNAAMKTVEDGIQPSA